MAQDDKEGKEQRLKRVFFPEESPVNVPQTDLTCSVKNLLAASLPMLVSLLSGALMHLFDRALLSYYLRDAMDGAFSAQYAGNLFFLPLLCFATVSEAFVGQFNGGGHYQKTSLPIFQIQFFLLICYALLVPFIWHFRSLVIISPSPVVYEAGCSYFGWLLATIPFQIVFATFSSFFVGTRRPTIIFYSFLVSNILNVVLDVPLIFGVGNWLPALGAEGAAIATFFATIVGLAIIFLYFINPYNATYYNTRHIRFNKKILKKNIALGLPFSLGYFVEMSVWVWVLRMLSKVSSDEVTVQNICVSFLNFFLFIVDGFQKGVMALSSNCIGAGKVELLSTLIKSLLKISVVLSFLIAIPLIFFPIYTLQAAFDITDIHLIEKFRGPLILVWAIVTLYLYSGSCFSGILSAGGDTRFLTWTKMTSILLFVALPMTAFFCCGTCSALRSWSCSVVYQIFNITCFYCRYRFGKWQHHLVDEVK